MVTLITIVGIVIIIALWGMATYNRLVVLRNQVKNAWSQIDVQLQRRYDLIPNLIETVKGYMTYEKSTLQSIVEARNQAASAREQIQKSGIGIPTEQTMKSLAGAEATLRSGLGNLFALAENYPQLKASETMKTLQEELSTTENKVAFARQAYNDQVLAYNNAQQKVPAVLVAGALGHHPGEMFEVESAETRKPVKVSF